MADGKPAMTETPVTASKAAPAKIDAAAEKAYAEAAAKKSATAKVAAPAVAEASKPIAAKAAAAEPAKAEPAAPVAPAPAKLVKKAAAKTVPTKSVAAKPAPAKSAPAKVVAAKKVATKASAAKPAKNKTTTAPTNPVTKLKETIMATAAKTDITASAKEMLADTQARVKTAFAKTGEMTAEAGEFAKGNVEAVVESGKIFFTGAQELMRDNLETGKTVVETVTEDAKKMAAIKSPTELMQLQGELARRNFDALVSYGSKRTEAWVKLYNEAFAPISNRVSVAAEKISKAA